MKPIKAKPLETTLSALEEAANNLTLRQLEFAQLYLADPRRDHLRCYMEIFGVTRQSAVVQCSKYLNLDHPVRKYIDLSLAEARAQGFMKLRVNEENVLTELFKMGFANIKDFYDDEGNMLPVNKITDEAASAVNKVREKVLKTYTNDDEEKVEVIQRDLELVDKKGALALLGQHLSMFKQQVDHNVEGEVKINQFFDAIAEDITDKMVSPLPADNLKLDRPLYDNRSRS